MTWYWWLAIALAVLALVYTLALGASAKRGDDIKDKSLHDGARDRRGAA